MRKLRTLVLLMMILLLRISNSQGQGPGMLDPLQGGENAAMAFVLSGPLPLLSSGTTAGFLDDYDEACPYPGDGSPDVVYSYTPPVTVTVNIDLCGSGYDTKLYVYENTVNPGFAVACNDDFYEDPGCGLYVSKIESLVLTGGNTYFIVIDGYNGDSGNYDLMISEPDQAGCLWGVDIICPPWAIPENETCGQDANGGCDMAPGTESWQSLPATGATICGTTWADGGQRDTDWFELVLAETSTVSLTANAEAEIIYGLVETAVPGAPACSDITGFINPGNTAGPCNETFLDLGTLAPGTYWFRVALTADDGFPCSQHYLIEFAVNPLSCPAPEALTVSGITTATADLGWIETGSASSWEIEYGPAYFTPSETGVVTGTNPVTITGLAPETDYDFYVRAVCGESDFSTWTGPFSFTTACDGTAIFPWAEGFESTWPPACWTDSDASDFGWAKSIYGFEHSGAEWAYCNKAGVVLTSPLFLLPSDAWLVFFYKAEMASAPQDLTVKIGNDIIYQLNGITNEEYMEAAVSLAPYIGQSISVSFTSGSGSGGTDAGICLDDVSLKRGFQWTGNLTSAWNDPGNWSQSDIPGQDDIVIIPSAPSGGRFPEVGDGISAMCYKITISPGASFALKSGSVLTLMNSP